MARQQKSRAKKEQLKGKAKEATGRAAADAPMTAKGKTEQMKGDARQAKEKIKDIFKH